LDPGSTCPSPGRESTLPRGLECSQRSTRKRGRAATSSVLEPRALEELVLAGEDLGDRVVDEDAADRVLEDVGAGELGDQVGGALAQRDGVRDHDPRKLRRRQRLERVAGKQSVRRDGVYLLCAL